MSTEPAPAQTPSPEQPPVTPHEPYQAARPYDPTASTASGPTPPRPPISPTPPQQPPQKKRRSHKKMATIFVSVFAAFLLLSLGTVGGVLISRHYSPNDTASLIAAVDGNKTITEEESSIATVAEKVGPSVVSIVTKTRTSSFLGDSSGQAAGTGMIVSKNGYVLTNNHVVEGAEAVSVIDSVGTLYENVTLVGRDPLNDIAFLKIESDKEFATVSLGNSATLRTGQQVVAIGNALGQYNNTVTSGIVSGTGRPVTASSGSGTTESLTDLIQTDASINPGNSGGPLVNMAGQVIGINTAIVEDANGIGFAIPINSTKGILAGVLETGKVSRSYLGVSFLTVTPDVAREYNLSVNNGAYVRSTNGSNPVAANSPADKAGLKQNDIITKVNDETVGNQGSLSSILGEYRPGDRITLTYLRDGKQETATLNLGAYGE